ncbi:MAG: hypothetical protein FJ267_00465 [Planctomycetes bacterium]|nr:hypothetical protein [Planctomycetota bacterium]
MKNRLDQKWEVYCTVAAVLIHLILFSINRKRVTTQNPPNPDSSLTVFVGLIPVSLLVTLFLVGIPSRIVLNLWTK